MSGQTAAFPDLGALHGGGVHRPAVRNEPDGDPAIVRARFEARLLERTGRETQDRATEALAGVIRQVSTPHEFSYGFAPNVAHDLAGFPGATGERLTRCRVCSNVTFGGVGGALASTTASTKAGPAARPRATWRRRFAVSVMV